MRRFLILVHRVPTGGQFTLNDLAGGGGRIDEIARSGGFHLPHGELGTGMAAHAVYHELGDEIWLERRKTPAAPAAPTRAGRHKPAPGV
ncbi:MAG: hypothetical protein L3K06_02020 [Thermoplasmata archaeon]|nr:hypothetical protein [Thermoplasmata archaeon]